MRMNNMKHLIQRSGLLAIFLTGLFSTNLYGQNWEEYDLTVVQRGMKDNQNFVVLEDADQRRFSVTFAEEFEDVILENILELHDTFANWESMSLRSISFMVAGENSLEILIYPATYTVNGEDYSQYLTAGMFFTYADSLYYNFRILVDRVFVGIKGIYIDEGAFNEKLSEAVADPRAYVNSRDPEFMLEKIDRMEVTLRRLQYLTIADLNRREVEQSIIDRVVALKKENPSTTSSAIAEDLKAEDIKIGSSTVDIILKVYFTE